jgi:hypothetical protein
MEQEPLVGQGLLIIEASRSHTDTANSIGLLWTNDHPGAETSAAQHTAFTRERHLSMPAAGFDPTIPAREQPQTHASDRAATGIGHTPFLISCNGISWINIEFSADEYMFSEISHSH